MGDSSMSVCREFRSSGAAIVAVLLWLGSQTPGEASPAFPPAHPAPEDAAGPDLEARIRDLETRIRELSAALESLRKSAGSVAPERIAELERQIEVLTREIERLRLGEAAAPPAATETERGFGPAASKIYRVKQGPSFGGYGELVYQNFDTRRDDGTASSATDTLDLLRAVFYFGYKWSDRFLFNAEIEYEHATTGSGDEEKGEVSVELAYVDFLIREGFNARAGLVLVPVGFVNELHEPPIFHGVRRPEVERVILPTTWRENGAGIHGDLGRFSYRAYLLAGLDASGFGPGTALRGGRQSGSESKAEDLALAGRLDLTGVPGLLAGISAYAGDSGQDGVDANARVTVWDAHVQCQWRGWEFRGLLASGSLEDAEEVNAALGAGAGTDDGVGEAFGGWYLQAAWDVLSLREGSGGASPHPFVRYEAFDTQDDVPAGFLEDPALDRTLWTVGVTWKPIPQIAIKADFQNADNDAGTGVDQFNVGLGWLF
jgi:hypothetical protein